MKIAIVILHYGSRSTTKACLQKLAKKIEDNSLILINNTQDDLTDLAKIIPHTKLINNNQNLGFAKGVNQGIIAALKDKSIQAVLLMNNDLSLTYGTLTQLALTFGKHSSAGIVSPILKHSLGFDWGGKFSKWSGMVKHKNWENSPKTTLSVDHVAGAAMLIKREVFEKIGYFDERFFLYFEDLDFCLRALEAHYTIHINPSVVAEHEVSAGSNLFGRTRYQWKSHFQFVSKHLFRLVMPTAYFYDLFIYPLWLLRSLIK